MCIDRMGAHAHVQQQLASHRLVNLTGLPGCGKSAVLSRYAQICAEDGPILFLKSDRLSGNTWAQHAASHGIQHAAAELLVEIGASGTPILFIDGIDRLRPDQKGVVADLLRDIETTPALSHWKVLASSRDQGLEAYRAWFPPGFYREAGICDITITAFDDDEAEELARLEPQLSGVLFGPTAVREIARRPFFAAVLARNRSNDVAPQTEPHLIAAWWARAGHDAPADLIPQRQRALLDLAETGVRALGKKIKARDLEPETMAHVAALKADLILREDDGGVSYSFSHDIFFEWCFFRLLLDLGEDWPKALRAAGEPPLLGRVVGLRAQHAFASAGEWSEGYRRLESGDLRAQWRREWLTAPPFSPKFQTAQEEFKALVFETDAALLEKLLVWFQAQHTVPSPYVLANPSIPAQGAEKLRLADLLGWPSDFLSWGRLIDWLLANIDAVPVRLLPLVLDVFGVWQNACAGIKNPRSESIVETCNAWLVDYETHAYADVRLPPEEEPKWTGLDLGGKKSFASPLRSLLMQGARTYPQHAIALYDRAAQNERMREKAYSDLMAYSSLMAQVAPEALAAVAKAQLVDELPKEHDARRRDEEERHFAFLKRVRETPKEKRTRNEQRALDSPSWIRGIERYDLEDVGVRRHETFYHPLAATYEPFASLFAKNPKVALGLVRDLSNRATTGWLQVHEFNRHEIGTPLPVKLTFPWGEQQFWGDWRVYSWSMGQLGPQSLECAYLAMAHWAYKEIEQGRSASEIIQAILEESICYAHLGLALCLALETFEVSEVTLPIVTCQRLWRHDMARMVQFPMRNFDPLGIGFLTRLTTAKTSAKEFLESRQSCTRNVRNLAIYFALSSEESLRESFKAKLAAFPQDLPYEREEDRASTRLTRKLLEEAQITAGFGDAANYRSAPVDDRRVLITYESPAENTPEQRARLDETTSFFSDQRALGWAQKSLVEHRHTEGWTVAEAVAFAKAADGPDMFRIRHEVPNSTKQSAISAIAACVIRFNAQPDRDWAWEVMDRIFEMQEPEGYRGSKIPWHPCIHLLAALQSDRRSASPRPASAHQMLALTAYPLDDVEEGAFRVLFMDNDETVRWAAAQLALDSALYFEPAIDQEGNRDYAATRAARGRALDRAQSALESADPAPLPTLPAAWQTIPATERQRLRGEGETIQIDPDPSFDARAAATTFAMFPVEDWYRSPRHRPLAEHAMLDFVRWTLERIGSAKRRRGADDWRLDLMEWSATLGDLMSRAAPFHSAQWVKDNFLAPFLAPGDETRFAIIRAFVNMSVTQHVFDAQTVPENTIDLLNHCADRVIADRCFDIQSYRAGEVSGFDLPVLIPALLMVNATDAARAARFANGDWSQIELIMPLVTKLVSAIGWSSYVMDQFLTLCERAGSAYPLESFAAQASAVLGKLRTSKISWAGTDYPARLAGVVETLVKTNFPLREDHALALLKVLDALIDLGDRRSTALEQSEYFRGVQNRGRG